jgi:hypothetical protein
LVLKKNNGQYSTGITNEEERGSKEITLVSNSSVRNYLSNSEFPLPLFDENSDNPVFHLKQLDNYVKLSDVPAARRLTMAYQSLNGVLSRQWTETVSSTQ